MDKEIKKAALRNALLHKGKAKVGAVLGKWMAKHPESDPREAKKKIELVVKEINNLSLEKQKNLASKLKVSLKVRKEERKGLPELPVKKGIRTRFAPNPDGPLHLGSARAAILSWLYAKKYDGNFILRFDDTDPRVKRPKKKFYRWILDELGWLGCKPREIYYQSDRLDLYKKKASELLERGKAYVCLCKLSRWRKLRDRSIACECRKLSAADQLDRFELTYDRYKEGEAVLRIKTNLAHKNPAIRDWPAMRIIEEPKHPRVGNKFRVWPLYNFASAIDDHELKIGLILRAQEHSTNTVKQRFLYSHLGWDYPLCVHHGRLSLGSALGSTSKIRESIKRGKYRGWSDPRLASIRALHRRGFHPECIKQLVKKLGPKSSDVKIQWKNLEARNRSIIDKQASRHFFIRNRKQIEVKRPLKKGKIELPLHPDYPERGNRKLKVGSKFFIEQDDFDRFKGNVIRLKELYNIRLEKTSECEGGKLIKQMPKIHWLPSQQAIEAALVMPNAAREKGLAELPLASEPEGTLVQLERVGFARIDSEEPLTLYYTHR